MCCRWVLLLRMCVQCSRCPSVHVAWVPLWTHLVVCCVLQPVATEHSELQLAMGGVVVAVTSSVVMMMDGLLSAWLWCVSQKLAAGAGYLQL
jgi:hypothetical protein